MIIDMFSEEFSRTIAHTADCYTCDEQVVYLAHFMRNGSVCCVVLTNYNVLLTGVPV